MKRAALAWILIGVPSFLGIFGFHSWPFSSFSMYSSNLSQRLTHEIWAMYADGKWFPVRDSRILRPPNALWLNYQLQKIVRSPDHEKDSIEVLRYYCTKRPFKNIAIMYVAKGPPEIVKEMPCE